MPENHDTNTDASTSHNETQKLSDITVRSIAELAQVAISNTECEALQSELFDIAELLNELSAIETTGIEPLNHPLELTQVLREDVSEEPSEAKRNAYQALSASAQDGFYLVPKVID